MAAPIGRPILWYNLNMIKIIAGGKKNTEAYEELIPEYEKRLRKPYALEWRFMPEEKLDAYLIEWPFQNNELVICCDERGKNISSDEFSAYLSEAFLDAREVIILIGGAYGLSDEVRQRADLVLSFSKLVFPHRLARVMMVEQIYRAQEIAKGSGYHHA